MGVLGDRLENNPKDIYIVKSTTKLFFIFSGIYFLSLACYFTTRKKFIFGIEYGSAKWESLKSISHLFSENLVKEEVKNIKKKQRKKKISSANKKKLIADAKEKYARSDIIISDDVRYCMHNFELNNNVLIFGGAGSGKSRGYVLPNILQCTKSEFSPSLVITDPKGEIIAKIGKYLIKCDYDIKILDLKELSRSWGYNPFKYILPHKYESGIKKMVNSVMRSNNFDETSNASKDEFWDESTRILLNALFFATYIAFPEKERNMTTVMKLFRWFEVTDNDDRYSNPTRLDMFFNALAKDSAIAEEYGSGFDNPALRNWEDFRSKYKGKTAQSVTACALAKLAPFDEKEIRRIFEKDELELDKVGEKKMAIIITLPPTGRDYNFIANIMYQQLFDQLEYCATVKHDQVLPHPVKFILEEFYNTGKIPDFENILSYARSFGISISMILQSMEQIKEMYEKSWGTVLDNCSALLYLGRIKSLDTLKYISELIGKGTFDKRSTSLSKGSSAGMSTSEDKFGRELMDASEVQKIKKDKCIVFLTGYDAFYTKKYRYTKHPNYKYTGDAKSTNKYFYSVRNATNNENATHREELIHLNTNTKEALEVLKDNILNFDFDNNEEIDVTNQEKEELEQLYEILQEDEESNEYIQTINKAFVSKPIEINLEETVLTDFIKESESLDNIEFDESISEELEEEIDNFIYQDIDIELELDSKFDEFVSQINSYEGLSDDGLEI